MVKLAMGVGNPGGVAGSVSRSPPAGTPAPASGRATVAARSGAVAFLDSLLAAFGFAAGLAVAAAGFAAALRGLAETFATVGFAAFLCAALALLPAFATFGAFAFGVFALADRRPAGTGFRFGGIFAFRIQPKVLGGRRSCQRQAHAPGRGHTAPEALNRCGPAPTIR